MIVRILMVRPMNEKSRTANKNRELVFFVLQKKILWSVFDIEQQASIFHRKTYIEHYRFQHRHQSNRMSSKIIWTSLTILFIQRKTEKETKYNERITVQQKKSNEIRLKLDWNCQINNNRRKRECVWAREEKRKTSI